MRDTFSCGPGRHARTLVQAKATMYIFAMIGISVFMVLEDGDAFLVENWMLLWFADRQCGQRGG